MPLVVGFVALVVVSSATEFNRHKFVVCTSPFSKLKHSSTDAPTELRRVPIDATMVHLFNCGSYFSTEFNEDEPSLPPNAYIKPSTSITSCVDLQTNTDALRDNKRSDFRQIAYLLECIAAIGSHVFRRGLNRSPLAMHMVPSLPPIQYKSPSNAATPQLLRRDVIFGTGVHSPTRGSNRSTDA